jgi:CRISPR-associated endonuclease/helicase Cas3
LAAHSREVLDKMSEISSALKGLGLDAHSEDLLTAALYHDWGKAHAVFQKTVNPDASAEPLAKSRRFGRHERKHFRHELASALALLQSDKSDLSAYLAAAHHGKVRLSIRALPDEDKPEKPNVRFARGVHDGDLLPATQLDGITTTPLTLDLELMLLGMSRRGALSWIDRMLELRDSLGVFRLAYLEALIIAADWRASMEPKEVIA